MPTAVERLTALRPRAVRALPTLAALLLLAGAFAMSRVARQRIDELRPVVERLEQLRATAERWQRDFVPASSAEMLAWRAVEDRVRTLGTFPDERLALAERIAAAAEGGGMRGVRVLFLSADSAGAGGFTRPTVGRIAFRPADYSLVLQGHGSLDAVHRALVALPPSVLVRHVALVREEGAVRLSAQILVFERSEAHATPGT